MDKGEQTPSARTERCPSTEVPSKAAPSGAASTWRPPAIVDRYRIESLIACGGMGQVYRAWEVGLERPVAVKFVLRIELDANTKRRFMVEARAAAQIQHPNVVTIYCVDELDGRPYLVMEYLAGKTLNKLTKPMDWARVREIGIGLASGLAAAHRKGVLHRDIKPDNVMLLDDGQVKVLDFGLAKFITRVSTPKMLPNPKRAQMPLPFVGAGSRSEGPEAKGGPPSSRILHEVDPLALTYAGAIVGTPGYMAPESWHGHGTEQSDLYSLGVLLFELCAGHTPFASVPPHALSTAVQQRAAPSLLELVPTINPEFAKIVARCVAREPKDRYASGDELLEALRALERPASSGPTPAGRADDPPAGSRGRSSRRGARSRRATRRAKTLVFRELGPLVVSVLSAEAPTDGEWSAYLELCRKQMAKGRLVVLAVTAGGGPTPEQRLAMRDLVRDAPVLTAVVTNVPTVQGIITVLGWQNPGIRTFSGDTGLADALKYLDVVGPLAERVAVEVTAMQHEVA